ncbi:MAG: hypothetical protein F4X02_09980 [Chloroflexi bacterium]|nr:hypothetical protein [Chloroflexota bacterium]
MRLRLIIVMVVLLSCAQLVNSRDSNLRSCTQAELAALADMRPGFDALIERGRIMQTRADYSATIESYFAWREDLRLQMPHCAELFEIALLMNQIASNQVARAVLDRALQIEGLSTKANPFVFEEYGDGSLPDQLTARIETAEAMLDEAERDSPVERGLPPCTDAELEVFYDEVFDRYFEQIETIADETSLANLLEIIEAQLPWRAGVWARLPACKDMYELTWLMTQTAGDMVTLFAFYLADMKAQYDLYYEETARLSATIAEMSPAFLGEATADVAPLESALPGCARSQFMDFVDVIVEYAELSAAAAEVASVDDVVAFGRQQYEWRERRLSDLPRCAEAFELGLLINQATGDVVLAMALLLAGVDQDEIPHMAAMQAGSARMSALVTPIIQGERAGGDSPVPGLLPQCTDARLALITDEIEPDYWAIMEASAAVETFDDLLRLGRMQIEFRESVWRRLPACAEAYDIAWLMVRVTGDDMITWALLAAGAAEDEIPYNAPVRANMRRLADMLSAIKGAAQDTEG